MMCINPIRIKRKLSDGSFRFDDVPCGKCAACVQRRVSDITFRLFQEYKHSTSAFFFTLTYDDCNIPLAEVDGTLYPTLRKEDVQKFLKRLRQHIHPMKVRYYIVGEYGPNTNRPHYHGILFNYPLGCDILQDIQSAWALYGCAIGFVKVSPITSGRISYVAKYASKLLLDNGCRPVHPVEEFTLQSRKPAIGSQFLTSELVNQYRIRHQTFVRDGGYKKHMPTYYTNKVFDSEHLKEVRRFELRKSIEKNESLQPSSPTGKSLPRKYSSYLSLERNIQKQLTKKKI